jgi:hypothetical protein
LEQERGEHDRHGRLDGEDRGHDAPHLAALKRSHERQRRDDCGYDDSGEPERRDPEAIAVNSVAE